MLIFSAKKMDFNCSPTLNERTSKDVSRVASDADVCEATNRHLESLFIINERICFAHESLVLKPAPPQTLLSLTRVFYDFGAKNALHESRRLCDSGRSTRCSHVTIAGFPISTRDRRGMLKQWKNVETGVDSIPKNHRPATSPG